MKKRLVLLLFAVCMFAANIVAQELVLNPRKARPWSAMFPTEKSVADKLMDRMPMLNVARAASDATVDPNLVIDDGTRIYGNITGWSFGDFVGIAEFRPVAGTTLKQAGKINLGTTACTYARGKYYGMTYKSAFGTVTEAKYYVYNAETWMLEKQITLEPQWYNAAQLYAYNPKDDKIYTISYDGLRRSYITTLNEETGTFNFLVQTTSDIKAIAFDSEGTLYGLLYNGNFVKININTAEQTVIAKVSNTDLVYGQTIAFDYHTGKLYWVGVIGEDWAVELRTIDPKTGAVAKIADLPSYMTMQGAYVKSPEANDKAPDTVTDLSVNFGVGGGTNGVVDFTAPSVAFDGTALSGELDYDLAVDGESVAKGKVNAGASASVTHEFATRGEHKVAITLSNASGNGPTGTITTYCGSDTPKAPKNVELSIDDSGNASLSWDAVSEGIHAGYVDASQITYTVTRMPDNTVVAENQTKTTFAEKLGEDVARYSYKVTAKFNDLVSEVSESNSIVYGKGFTVPFETQVGNEDFFNLCTVIDNDNDGNTFYTTWGSASTYVPYGTEHTADDWLITPPFYLEPGLYYYDMTFYSTDASTECSMKFTMGREATIEGQKDVLADYPAFTNANGQIVVKKVLRITEAGKYYFGVNAYSHTDGSVMPYASVSKMRLRKGPEMNAPQALQITGGGTYPKGELKNKIEFKAPTKAIDGTSLSSITKVSLCDGTGKEITSLTNVEPGKSYTIVDENAKQGANPYLLYAYNEAGGQGVETEANIYAGKDTPSYVTEPSFTIENNQKINFTWNYPPEVGMNGGYVDQKAVVYDIGRSTGSQSPVTQKYGLKELSWSFNEGDLSSEFAKKQNMFTYSITPRNEMGSGPAMMVSLVLGPAYQAPFKESFANGAAASSYWSIISVKGLHSWNMVSNDSPTGITPYDDDNGMLLFYHQGEMDSQEALVTPLFALQNMKKPAVSFYMKHDSKATDGAYLSVQISKNDENYKPLGDFIYVNDGTDGWKQHVISLNDWNDLERLQIALLGSNKTSPIAIDKFEIYDDLANDVALTSITAPAAFGINEGGELVVEVINKGRQDIAKYSLDLYADGKLVDKLEQTNFAASATKEVKFNLKPEAPYGGKTVNYEVQVNLDSDENDLNDKASAEVNVLASALPAPASLTGAIDGKNVNLSWSAPGASKQEQREDSFEDYQKFAIDGVGEWKFVDNDKQLSDAISGADFPHAQAVKSFQVWNPDGLKVSDSWKPRTGNQCLICFAASGVYPDMTSAPQKQNDDWLISPSVVGGTTVKFYASESEPVYGNEKFEFMVSYNSQAIEDFSALETVTLPGAGWHEYSFDLPADARYFAIHCISSGTFALLIDDISYTAGYSGLEFLGYNLYRDGERLNSDLLSALTFVDSDVVDGNAEYGVSAIYDLGESPMATWVKQSGVDAVATSSAVVIGSDGCLLVKNATGELVCVFNGAGVKVAELKATSSIERISTEAGVYVVTVGGNVYKAIVK